jgi:hypothetical protein
MYFIPGTDVDFWRGECMEFVVCCCYCELLGVGICAFGVHWRLMPDSLALFCFPGLFVETKDLRLRNTTAFRFSLTFVAVNIVTTWWYPTKYLPNESFDEMRNVSVAM